MNAPSPRPGMGATPYAGGTTFRVWAPHASWVHVAGDFNGWHGRAHELLRDGDGTSGTFSRDVDGARPGQQYQFVLGFPYRDDLWRIDPYARSVTSSVGNAVIHDPHDFEWWGDDFTPPPLDDLVIYELHVGTFAAEGYHRGTFGRARGKLDYLRDLGVSAIHVMPVSEFAGDQSWGYNPAHLFAIESSHGGPHEFKAFIKDAHQHGIAVILDVVLNHLGPSDLAVWQFDGWSENDKGGIYFYQDERSSTPWGDTRPDYGRLEVRSYLRDSVLTWLGEFHVDGLRFDATNYVRRIDGVSHDLRNQIAEGWWFLSWVNEEIRRHLPHKFTIAEDMQGDPAIVTPTWRGGAGFDAQWDADFVHTVRAAVVPADDAQRSMSAVAQAVAGREGMPPRSRVVYTESHDEVANGKARVPETIQPGRADSWWATKRAMLGSALVMTTPGVPLIFQGQEMLEDSYFRDDEWLDWSKVGRYKGIVALHRDLIALRRNKFGTTAGLRGTGLTFLRVDDDHKVLVMHRFARGGPGDDVVVALNFTAKAVHDYRVGLPAPGRWVVRLNSDSTAYSPEFGGHENFDVDATGEPMDGCEQSGALTLGPYSVVIYSRAD